MKTIFHDKFPELLLTCLLILTGGIILCLIHKGCDGKPLDWATGVFASILSGLLIAIRVGGPAGGGNPPPVPK
jgi:hypothetical protein